jgi:hypothetical protein
MIWNPFRKSKQLSEAEMLDFAKLIAAPLQAQLMLAGNCSIVSSAGTPNPRAVGYVYGWTDAFLRVRGWDMADINIGVPVLFHALRHLWPGEQDTLMYYLIRHLTDSEVRAAMMHGGQQYLDWRNRKLPTPAGLAKCIIAPPD